MPSRVLNFPNLTTKWCFILIMLVSEWLRATTIPFFIFIFWYAYINSLEFYWCWWAFFTSAFPLHWTIFFLFTITKKFLIFPWLKYVLIVAAYYFGKIFCITITYFNWVTIEYFMQLVLFSKFLSNSFKKVWAMFVTTFIVWQVEPNDLTFPLFVTFFV